MLVVKLRMAQKKSLAYRSVTSLTRQLCPDDGESPTETDTPPDKHPSKSTLKSTDKKQRRLIFVCHLRHTIA